uniref:Ig-like domain-containing protein n=1 Tax=Jaculus jaculus TaxID=51337 RepID=A0A8C5K2N4_JACJA
MIWQVLLVLPLTLAGTLAGLLTAQVCDCPRGVSINITRFTSGALYGIYLMHSWPQNSQTVDKHFRDRINFSLSQETLTITMSLLRLTDSGAYTCWASMGMVDAWGSTTVVVVTEKLPKGAYRCQKPLLTSVTLAVGFFLTGLDLGVLCMLRKTQIKKLCASREKNLPCVVYEDMSCSCLNASSVSNQY